MNYYENDSGHETICGGCERAEYRCLCEDNDGLVDEEPPPVTRPGDSDAVLYVNAPVEPCPDTERASDPLIPSANFAVVRLEAVTRRLLRRESVTSTLSRAESDLQVVSTLYPKGTLLEVVALTDGEVPECFQCGAALSHDDVTCPALTDDAAWAKLAERHHPHCRWIECRGSMLFALALSRAEDAEVFS